MSGMAYRVPSIISSIYHWIQRSVLFIMGGLQWARGTRRKGFLGHLVGCPPHWMTFLQRHPRKGIPSCHTHIKLFSRREVTLMAAANSPHAFFIQFLTPWCLVPSGLLRPILCQRGLWLWCNTIGPWFSLDCPKAESTASYPQCGIHTLLTCRGIWFSWGSSHPFTVSHIETLGFLLFCFSLGYLWNSFKLLSLNSKLPSVILSGNRSISVVTSILLETSIQVKSVSFHLMQTSGPQRGPGPQATFLLHTSFHVSPRLPKITVSPTCSSASPACQSNTLLLCRTRDTDTWHVGFLDALDSGTAQQESGS